MKKIGYFSFICLFLLGGLVNCKHTKEEQLTPIVSFHPEDSTAIDELFDFYIENGIILPEMLKDPTTASVDFFHSYDDLIDDCEITHDYLQDSLSGYFFMELSCFSGSCGNNIYIIHKDRESNLFQVLYNECGVIDSDLGPDTLIHNFKVIYYTTEGNHYKLYFDGQQFTSEILNKLPQL